ncbi:MAG: glycoside hydrolase family 57 protein [Thermoplasmata archaeon]|nr:glycoside hydrolase family 57 protein [Thermoplasmata archaeon]
MKLVLYLHMHQPWRLARFRYVDLGTGRPYIDRERNLAIFRRISERCYRPALTRLLEALERFPEFRFSLSVTGTFIEQARAAAPDVLELLRRAAATGRVSFLAETYYHSLSFLLPPPELSEEIDLHVSTLHDLFGVTPTMLRMTELAYSDELGYFAERHGFKGMLAEGWESALGDRSPNQVYAGARAPNLKLLLRNYRLSDDVGFRFSARGWSEYPLTAEKYAGWLAATPGRVLGLFMDFETFGEHHDVSTGILDFLQALPRFVDRERTLSWSTVEEAVAEPAQGPLGVPTTMTWADQNRDLGAWLGNDLQRSAFEAAKKMGTLARRSGDAELLGIWRQLMTSDHFYYMYLGAHGADMGVHQYFSSYGSPYDAYANYMNALTDLRRRALEASGVKPLA